MTRYSDPPTAHTLRQDCDLLLEQYNNLDELRQKAIQALDALTAAGIYDSIPTPTMERRRENGGEAMRLLFPTKDGTRRGTRRREYIGTDPDAQAAALAQIERTRQAQALEKLTDDIGHTLKRLAADLHRAARDVTMSCRHYQDRLHNLT